VSIRASQYGEPTTSTTSNAKLYSPIPTVRNVLRIAVLSVLRTAALISPHVATRTSEDHNQPCMFPYRTPALTGLAVVAALSCLSLPSLAVPPKGPAPAKPADAYPANDTHPNERVTIAADPCDDPKLCSFFRLPYIEHGLLPIRVIVTNDSDQAISLADARMHFISANNDKIPAATEEDIDRRLSSLHNDQGTRIPIIPITVHLPVDKKITQDDNEFGFQSSTVQPHSTLAGYLFYDIKDLDEPALRSAQLDVKMVRTKDTKLELFAFSIPFDKWLAANPNAPSNHPRR
jgi:hypothetical protein